MHLYWLFGLLVYRSRLTFDDPYGSSIVLIGLVPISSFLLMNSFFSLILRLFNKEHSQIYEFNCINIQSRVLSYISSRDLMKLFSRVLRDSTPCFVGPSVRPSVCWSVHHTLLFFCFCGLWPHCSCPNDQVTTNTAPAHPHATGVAVYPALFGNISVFVSETVSDRTAH